MIKQSSKIRTRQECHEINCIKKLLHDRSDAVLYLCSGIHSLGSPLWGENGGLKSRADGFDPSLPLFLLALRGVLRSALASALITIPVHLFHVSTSSLLTFVSLS